MADYDLQNEIEALCSSDEEGTSPSTVSIINAISTASPRRAHLLSIVLNQRIRELGGRFEWVRGRFRPLPPRASPTVRSTPLPRSHVDLSSRGRQRRSASSRAGALLRRTQRLRSLNPVRRAQLFLQNAVNSCIRRRSLRSNTITDTVAQASPDVRGPYPITPDRQTLPSNSTLIVRRRTPPPRPPRPESRPASTATQTVNVDGQVNFSGGHTRIITRRTLNGTTVTSTDIPPRSNATLNTTSVNPTVSSPAISRAESPSRPPPPPPHPVRAWVASQLPPPTRPSSRLMSTPQVPGSVTAPGPWPITPVRPGPRIPSYVGGLRPAVIIPPSTVIPRFSSSYFSPSGTLVRFQHENPLPDSFIAQYNPVTRLNRQPTQRLPLVDLEPTWVSPEVEALTIGRSTNTPPSPSPPTYTPASPDYPPPTPYDHVSDVSETASIMSEREIDDELSYVPDREPPTPVRGNQGQDDSEEEEEENRLCSGVPCPPWGKMLSCSVHKRCWVCLEVGHHRVYCQKCVQVVMCCSCHYNAFRSPYCDSCPLCRHAGPPPPLPPTPDFATRARNLLTTLDSMREDLRAVSTPQSTLSETRQVFSSASQTLSEQEIPMDQHHSQQDPPPQVAGNLPAFEIEVEVDEEEDTEVIIMNGLDESGEESDDEMDQAVSR